MPKTINLEKIISTRLFDEGMIGDTQQFGVEILFRRGQGIENSEQIKIVIPVEEFILAQQVVSNQIKRRIQQSTYLKGLLK